MSETEMVDTDVNESSPAQEVNATGTESDVPAKCYTVLECGRLFIAHVGAAITALMFPLLSKLSLLYTFVVSKLSLLKVLVVKFSSKLVGGRLLATFASPLKYAGMVLRFLFAFCLGLYNELWLPIFRRIGLVKSVVPIPPTDDDADDGSGGRWPPAQRLRPFAYIATGILLDRTALSMAQSRAPALSAAKALNAPQWHSVGLGPTAILSLPLRGATSMRLRPVKSREPIFSA